MRKMPFSILVLLLLIKTSEGGVYFRESYLDEETVLSCVNRIVKRHFDLERQVTILTQGSKDYVKGMEISTVRLIVNTYTSDKVSWFLHTKQVVVFLDGDSDLDLRILMSLGSFHPRSRFLIVCTIRDNSLSTKNYLIKIVHHLHEYKRLAVAIAVKSIDEDDQLYLYGFTVTAAQGNCGNPKILSFGNCSSKKNVRRLFSTIINYNRCPLRLATFEWPPLTSFVNINGRKKSIGIESSIVELIADRLNASTSFIDAPPSQIRLMIGNNDADIGYGQMAMYDTSQYSYTSSYTSAQGLVLLPKISSEFPPTLNNLMPLQMTVWILLMIVVIFVIILRSFFPVFKGISLLDTLALFIGLGVTARPTRNSQRGYFISLVIFGYIITQAYLANLTMIFTSSIGYEAIGSLEDLEKSTISIGGAPSSVKFFENKYPRLSNEFQVMNLSGFKDNLANMKLGEESIATYVEVTEYVNYNKWKHTTTVPEIITYYPLALVVPNVSTILPTCNRIVAKIVEAGLMEHWAFVFNDLKLEINDITAKTDDDNGRMALQQFLTIFRLLGIALALSTSVFIIELLAAFWRTKRRQFF